MARHLPRNPKASSQAIRAYMPVNRAKETIPELVVRALLREQDFTVYRLHSKTPERRVSIAFMGRKVTVKVYWCFCIGVQSAFDSLRCATAHFGCRSLLPILFGIRGCAQSYYV